MVTVAQKTQIGGSPPLPSGLQAKSPPKPLFSQPTDSQQETIERSESFSSNGRPLTQREFEVANRPAFVAKYGKYADQALVLAYGKYYQSTEKNPDFQTLQSLKAGSSNLPKEIRREIGSIGVVQYGPTSKQIQSIGSSPLIIEGEPVIGGFSSGTPGKFDPKATGQSIFITASGKQVTRFPASFQPTPASFNQPVSSPSVPKGTLPSSFVENIQGARFSEFQAQKIPSLSNQTNGVVSVERKDVIRQAQTANQIENYPRNFLETVPLYKGLYEKTPSARKKDLLEELAKLKVRERVETSVLEPLSFKRQERQTKKEKSNLELYRDVFGRPSIGEGVASGFVTGASLFLDPQKTSRDIIGLGKEVFSIKKVKGVPQIYAESQKVSEIKEIISKQAKSDPEFFLGQAAGGAAFDKALGGPLISYLGRPAVNIASQARLFSKGVETGVVEGTTGVSYFRTKEGLKFLLVENIHTPVKQVPGVGDIPLSELVRQTKAGTGQPIITGTFARGSLAGGTPGDKFLVREFETHYGGFRSTGLFASPQLELQKDLTVVLSSGKKIIVPKGEVVGVGAKQFASDLVQSTSQESKTISLFKERNSLLVGKEPVILPKTKGETTIDVSKSYFSKEASGKFSIAPQEVLPVGRPTATEREIVAQAQRVFPFKSRGSILGFKETGALAEVPRPTSFPIYSRKPFFKELSTFFPEETQSYRPYVSGLKSKVASLSDRFPNFEKIYEDVGLGREYRDISVSGVGLSVPVGRPPKQTEFAERPRVGAIIRESGSEKILFVKEGEQPFLFPGGGVEPVLVPGQGKEGVRLAYPKKFGPDLRREVFEETGLSIRPQKSPTSSGLRTNPRALNPLVGPKGAKEPAFIFQDVSKVFESKVRIFDPSPKGEITQMALFTPEEALTKNIGSIERQTIEGMLGKSSKVINQESLVSSSARPSSSERIRPPSISLVEESNVFSRSPIVKLSQRQRRETFEQRDRLRQTPRFRYFREGERIYEPSRFGYERIVQPEKRGLREPFSREYPRIRTESYSGVFEREKPIKDRSFFVEEPSRAIEEIREVKTPVREGSREGFRFRPIPFSPKTTSRFDTRRRMGQRQRIAETGFGVALFKAGKLFKIVPTAPLTKTEAINLGKIITGRQELLRSFKIFQTGIATPRGIKEPLGEKFRFGKRDPSLFVEESRSALSSPQEIARIQSARKNKKNGRRIY